MAKTRTKIKLILGLIALIIFIGAIFRFSFIYFYPVDCYTGEIIEIKTEIVNRGGDDIYSYQVRLKGSAKTPLGTKHDISTVACYDIIEGYNDYDGAFGIKHQDNLDEIEKWKAIGFNTPIKYMSHNGKVELIED
jgi:hypothetical protein